MSRFIVPTFALLLVIAQPARAATEADVVVYGSTPGGFCAAIAAAREGSSVILLEPTDHVGAMSTGGLSHCDSNQMVRGTLMGLFDEWHTRIVKDYTDRGLKAPYDPAMKDQSRWVFEPHVAMRVTKKMLDEAGVKVLVSERLKAIKMEGSRITSLVTKTGTFNAKVYVDGTYEGDLMAEAGVEWAIGREGRAEYDEPLAGKRYPKKKMDIDGFDEKGKLLPLLTTDDGGKEDAGDLNIMTYSFRLCLTADPKNRVPMPKPEKYDPGRFEIIRRYLKAGGDVKQVGFDLYPLPGDKLDGNNSIGHQFSIGLVGGGNDWHKADGVGRKAIWEAHKQYTLEFFQFLTTDPAVPKNTQNIYANLGLCKDEFADYDHFSPALYVRESRRMKGLYVISQKDILTDPKKDDPIAIASFPIDSHDVQRVALKGGGVINEGTIFPVRKKDPKQGYAYHVPYRSVLPTPEQCVNLLVPVALSCTHVGMSSLRIEGAWMVIGQGAGVAAALAVKEKVAVQDVPYEKLRKRLLAQGQVLDLPVPPKTEGRKTAVKWNLLLVTADDMNADSVGWMGNKLNLTPNVDAFAKTAHRLLNNHNTCPICQPGREALLTGRVPHRSGALGFNPIKKDVPTLVEVLKEAGYYTAAIEKIIHMAPADKFPWDDKQQGGMGKDPAKMRAAVKEILAKAAESKKPFFLNANITDPHRPFFGVGGNAKGEGSTDGITPLTAKDVTVPSFLEDLPKVREEVAQYYSSVKRLDASFAAIMDELKAAGRVDDTLVVFWSDHGMSFPFSKATVYYNGTWSPVLVRIPGMEKPKELTEFVSSVDVMPSLLGLLKVDPPKGMDGRSWVPLLNGETQPDRDFVVTHVNTVSSGKAFPQRCVRNQTHSLQFHAWVGEGTPFRVEAMSGLSFNAMNASTDEAVKKRVKQLVEGEKLALYDLTADPNERVNVIGKKENAKVLADLSAKLLAHMKTTDDPQTKAFEAALAERSK